MAGVKGSLAEHYWNKDQGQHGMPFKYPSKIIPTISTTSTENIIQDIITTTTESTIKIKDIITAVVTNLNNTQDASDTNNTFIDENVKSNSTFNTGNVITESISIATNNTGVTADSISTTQSALDWVTNGVTDVFTYEKDDGNTTTSEHDMYTNYHNTSYIIMGVLIGILIIIGVGLIAVYTSYKKKNSAHMNTQYHSQASKEIPTSSMGNLEELKIDHQKC